MRRILTILIAATLTTVLFAMLVGPALAAGKTQSDHITWYQAKRHVGERVTVKGPVVATAYEKAMQGHPTFLNLGKDYPSKSRCSIVILKKYRGAFPFRPELKYRGKTLLVTGKVRWFQGCANIFVRSPAAIRIVEKVY